MKDVVIVDYGMGNIKSVQRGLEHVGATVTLSSDPEVIKTANRVLLPGVGAFEEGMKELQKANLIPAIQEFVNTGKSLLGICLGMQMFLENSEEHGSHQGLGLIQGSVKAIPQNEDGLFVRKTPHIGWSELKFHDKNLNGSGTCLEDINVGEYFYFVHSYIAVPKNSSDLLAYCEYEGLPITAAIRKDNVTGLQFHPEKSAEFGLKILRKFVNE